MFESLQNILLEKHTAESNSPPKIIKNKETSTFKPKVQEEEKLAFTKKELQEIIH